MSAFSSFVKQAWFIALAVAVFGFALGVWLDAFVRSRESFFLTDDQFERVTGRSLMNEEILLDGRWFDKCKFSACTFKFNGKKQYRLSKNEIFPPVAFASDNPGIVSMVRLMHAFGATTLPIIDEEGKLAVRGMKHVVASRNGKAVEILPHGQIDHKQDFFKGLVISMSDFYDGTTEPHRDKIFQDCDVIGPAVLRFAGHIAIDEGSDMHLNDLVEIKKGAKLVNVITFHNITIRRSTFRGMTILVTEGEGHHISGDANWITQITRKDLSFGNQSP
jgi:hypothetical protein